MTTIDPAADVVIATLPDGSIRIVKGEAMLERIVANRRTERAHVQFLPVAGHGEAEALIRRHGAH